MMMMFPAQHGSLEAQAALREAAAGVPKMICLGLPWSGGKDRPSDSGLRIAQVRECRHY